MAKSRENRWGIVLGFALGGFFDGILLHQVLQWHHLLSLVPRIDSLRLQVLWDGYFHALMYIVAIVGLYGLWRTRSEGVARDGRSLIGALLIGFGIWHLVDSILSHWILGIHRIKLDSPNPLMWDLIWLAAFGILPLLVGVLLGRRAAARPALGQSTMSLLLAGVLTAGTAVWSAQPPKGQDFTTIVFSPTVSPQEAMAAVVAEGGGLVWSDSTMGVLVIDLPSERRLNFYRHGALLVGGSGIAGGCLNWSAA